MSRPKNVLRLQFGGVSRGELVQRSKVLAIGVGRIGRDEGAVLDADDDTGVGQSVHQRIADDTHQPARSLWISALSGAGSNIQLSAMHSNVSSRK